MFLFTSGGDFLHLKDSVSGPWTGETRKPEDTELILLPASMDSVLGLPLPGAASASLRKQGGCDTSVVPNTSPSPAVK